MPSESVGYELARPPAHAMIESLRGVGYSVETAIADLIDNSVAAGARNVWLDFRFDGPASWLTILDDGAGMDADGLRVAMTLGGRSPLEGRSSRDLGRFGMGLKTASFSQCRCLTVASRPPNGEIHVRRWDLDYIARPEVNEWRLLREPAEGSEERLSSLGQRRSGTLVLWERMDRITAGLSGDRKSHSAFLTTAARVERHLAMVFHRYLEGARLRIHLNGARVKPWDPFLTEHQTPFSPVERIPDVGGLVELQGFVLPHRDQLDQETYDRAGGRDGWTSQQGFYVYRNDRMLVSGGWLGLGQPRTWTREEPFKLARLSVSFPNTADADWEIDIKKSTARPPRKLRPRLTDLAESVRTEARRVFAHRGAYGARAQVPDLVPAWIASSGKSGPAYRVNRDHPSVARISELLGENAGAVDQLLALLERTVPVQRIWLDAVEHGDLQPATETATPDELRSLEGMAATLFSHLTGRVGLTPAIAITRLRSTDPFQNHPEIIDRLESAA